MQLFEKWLRDGGSPSDRDSACEDSGDFGALNLFCDARRSRLVSGREPSLYRHPLHRLIQEGIIPRMAKLCPECSTSVADESPYCDACGCQFSKNPAKPVAESSRWKYLSVFIVVAVVVTFLVLGRSCGAGG